MCISGKKVLQALPPPPSDHVLLFGSTLAPRKFLGWSKIHTLVCRGREISFPSLECCGHENLIGLCKQH